LLVAGASVAFGQSCYTQSADNCTGMMFPGMGGMAASSCAVNAGYCSRLSNATACDTSSMTSCNTAAACKVGTNPTNLTSCSKCADACAGSKQADCTSSGMNNMCQWNAPTCINAPAPTPCVSQTTQGACTGEAGCYWLSFNRNWCGASSPIMRCLPCNSTSYDLPTRSAISHNVGKTCSWPAAAPYVQGTSLTINAIAQSDDAVNCPAMMAMGMGDADSLIVTTVAAAGAFGPAGFDITTKGTCATQSSDVPALIPSVAVAVFVAMLA